MADVRRVRPGEWDRIKAIRLEMLVDTPDAYITTLEEAESFPDSVWIERAEKGSMGSVQATFIGFDGDVAVAMAIGLRKRRFREDILVIVSVYVSPTHRGTALASELMGAVENWGLDWKAPAASLWVAETNDRARAFYTRLGYQPTGDRTRMKPESDRMEIRLEKPLPSGPM
jgi:GNAT superfamily N-acetyltransferase